MQPGPIYFLTPRKCAIFGVSCESVPRQVSKTWVKYVTHDFQFQQVNYLIDEACNVGKGANSIISMLHHFLETYGFGETHLHLHADNCAGQNKNRYMMAYLLWRVLVGLSEEVTISFLLVGHTKFAPDWGFGLFKRLYKRTKVGTITDIAEVVRRSATVNYPQLVGSYDGSSFVNFYDWSSMFEDTTTAIKGITKFHHFRFSRHHPGRVFVKIASDEPERMINILKDRTWKPSTDVLPTIIDPPGLPLDRQWYLYNKIREFCPEEAKDLVCPLPSQPL